MLISPAYAQEAAGGLFGGGIIGLLPIVAIFVVFYFLLIRPQQRKQKQHRAMISAIRRGDSVLTGGGIVGRVTKVLENGRVMVEVAEGIRVQVATATVTEVLNRPEPASGGGGGKTAAAEKK
jgi:preprotein translocase subunit YajC